LKDTQIEIICKNIDWDNKITNKSFLHHISGYYYSKYWCRKDLPETVTVSINLETPIFSKLLFKVSNIIDLSNKDLLNLISFEITCKTGWLIKGFDIEEVTSTDDEPSLYFKRNIKNKLGISLVSSL
jgi:hypothetical protein